MRRLGFALLVCLVVAGCQLIEAAGVTPLGSDGVPLGWHQRAGVPNPGLWWTKSWISPQELPSECTTDATTGVTECRPWPVMTLDPGGIVVAFRQRVGPGGSPPTDGTAIRSNGQPAFELVGADDPGCAAIGGDQAVRVVVKPAAGEQGWSEIDACLAGPDHTGGRRVFETIAGITSAG